MFDVNAQLKLFYKMNDEKMAKQMVEYNLKKYKKEILTKSFPTNYLNISYLVQQREKLKNIYMQKGYLLSSDDDIIKRVELLIEKLKLIPNLKKINRVFVCSKIKYTNMIYPSEKKITGFVEEWLSLLNVVPDISGTIKKGYEVSRKKKFTPYIEEIIVSGYDKLKTDCYLYYVSKKNFKYSNRTYKLKCDVTC